jgi:hypothetical protein
MSAKELLQLKKAIAIRLETEGKRPDPDISGITHFDCPLHDDTKRKGWFAGGKWGCWVCDIREPVERLAARLGLSGADIQPVTKEEYEEYKKNVERAQKDRAKISRKLAMDSEKIWGDKKITLDYHGDWYFTRHRGVSSEFAANYGVRSFGPGLFPLDHRKRTGGARLLKPPPHFRRWGFLLIPYYTQSERYPTTYTMRVALPNEYIKRPPHIKQWPSPNRYTSPRGHSKSTLFHQRCLTHPSDSDSDTLFVVEGEIDAMALLEHGFMAVGLGGTNGAWNALGQIMEEADHVKKIYLMADADEAGMSSFVKRADHLSHHTSAEIRVVRPPNGSKDMDEYYRKVDTSE